MHKSDAGWDCAQLLLKRDAREWETAVPDHLSAVYGALVTHIQRFLPPGFVPPVPPEAGFDTFEFVLGDRDFDDLVSRARAFGESLDKEMGAKSVGRTLRVYLGQCFDRLPR